MNYPTVFDLIAEVAGKANARLVLIGGFAVNARGVARNTQDVDFLTTEADYQEMKPLLSAAGFDETVRTDVFAKQTTKNPGTMPVDFLFVDPDTFESIWQGGIETAVCGRQFKTPSLLHLIALKLHAIKKGSKDRVWKDLPDIANLVLSNRLDVMAFDFLEICRKYGPDGIHQKILEMTQGGSPGRS